MLITVMLPTVDHLKTKDIFTVSHGSLKNIFSLFEFSFPGVAVSFGGRDWVWRDCHKRTVGEKHVLSPLVKGDSL